MGESFKDLRVWKCAVKMALANYRLTSLFPDSERFGLTSQLRRAGVSAAANISEGYGRSSRGEYLQVLCIARGSLCEVETLLIIARELGYGTDRALLEAELLCTATSMQLNTLIHALRPESLSPISKLK